MGGGGTAESKTKTKPGGGGGGGKVGAVRQSRARACYRWSPSTSGEPRVGVGGTAVRSPDARLTCWRAPRPGGGEQDHNACGSSAASCPTAVRAEPPVPPGSACGHHGSDFFLDPRGQSALSLSLFLPSLSLTRAFSFSARGAPRQALEGPGLPLRLGGGGAHRPRGGPGPHACFLRALRAPRLVGNQEDGGAPCTSGHSRDPEGSVRVFGSGLLLAARAFFSGSRGRLY